MMSSMKQHRQGMVRPYGRLKLVSAGVVLALFGTARMLRGIQVVQTSRSQPMFSWGLIAAGFVCVAFALIPLSWIAKAASTRPKDATKSRAQRGISR